MLYSSIDLNLWSAAPRRAHSGCAALIAISDEGDYRWVHTPLLEGPTQVLMQHGIEGLGKVDENHGEWFALLLTQFEYALYDQQVFGTPRDL